MTTMAKHRLDCCCCCCMLACGRQFPPPGFLIPGATIIARSCGDMIMFDPQPVASCMPLLLTSCKCKSEHLANGYFNTKGPLCRLQVCGWTHHPSSVCIQLSLLSTCHNYYGESETSMMLLDMGPKVMKYKTLVFEALNFITSIPISRLVIDVACTTFTSDVMYLCFKSVSSSPLSSI